MDTHLTVGGGGGSEMGAVTLSTGAMGGCSGSAVGASCSDFLQLRYKCLVHAADAQEGIIIRKMMTKILG